MALAVARCPDQERRASHEVRTMSYGLLGSFPWVHSEWRRAQERIRIRISCLCKRRGGSFYGDRMPTGAGGEGSKTGWENLGNGEQ